MKKKDDRDWDKWFEWLIEDWIAPLGILALVIWVVVKLAQLS